MRHLFAVAFLLLLFFSAALLADENRVEYFALLDGVRLEQSEVCFFPADEDDGFFKKFLSTDDVRCLSADDVISLPPGLFNVFVRNESSLVSAHPSFVNNENPGEPTYRRIAESLLPAATLDVSAALPGLRQGEWLAIYLSNESLAESLASVRPVTKGESKVIVPAGMALVPLVVRQGAIVRVGTPMTLRAGEAKSLANLTQWGSGLDVVAVVRTDALTFEDVPSEPPSVQLHPDGAAALQPLLPLRKSGLFERSLVVFKNVPQGTHHIRVSGDGWQPDELTVVSSSAPAVATPHRPVFAKVAASVQVRSSLGELASINADVRCPNVNPKEPVVEAPRPILRLLRCADSEHCEIASEMSLNADEPERVVTWSDLKPDAYVVELEYLGMKERVQVEARAGAMEMVAIALRSEAVSGRVMHGTSPVQALVSFDHSVLPALSDASGNYTAAVAGGPRRSIVTVRLCDGGAYRYLPNDPVDKVLDIVIPKNRLVVRVVDEQQRPLADASVNGGPLFPDGEAEYTFLPFSPTDASGETQLDNVVTDAPLRLCATHPPGYDQACAPNFEIGKRESHTLEIALRSRPAMSGKLRSNSPFDAAVIWLVSTQGIVVDAGLVSEDGLFTLKRTAGVGDYLVVVSRSHPLAVFDLPTALVDETLEFPMPVQPRALAITLTPHSRRRQVALEVAGRIIPTRVFWRHQMLRRMGDVASPGETMEIRDLGPGELAVYSVPHFTDYPPEWANLDPMEHPNLRIAIPRFKVTGPIVTIE